MNAFIQSAESRETSIEIMEAIAKLAEQLGCDERMAVRMWEAPTQQELVQVIEIVTKNGLHDATDFCWGSAGDQWAA